RLRLAGRGVVAALAFVAFVPLWASLACRGGDPPRERPVWTPRGRARHTSRALHPVSRPALRPASRPALPVFRRRRPVPKPLSPEEVKRRECDAIYQDRVHSLDVARRFLAREAKRSAKKGHGGARGRKRAAKAPKLSAIQSRSDFIESCQTMPLEVIRCLNPRNRAALGTRCIKVLMSLGKGKSLNLFGARSRKKKKGRHRCRRPRGR
ncbi:MAG: hypothetical protein KAI47_02775, partial [Deltaproteobacteria bacterium]|nr:hypothetical protein [Deltaproteobacteria bacterium]